MSAVSNTQPSQGANELEWLPVAIGLLVLCIPTFYGLSTTVWKSDDQTHGPIILIVIIWLFWQKRESLFVLNRPTLPVFGFALLVFGVLVYGLGRSQDILFFEVGALIPVLAGVLIVMCGWPAIRTFWFPILFIAFLVPLPGFFVDAVTGPLKQNVSMLAEQILFSAGYPIARSGIVLNIGQYQLLVEDACSGLNSMFSLSALGVLYLYLMGSSSTWRNGILLLAILPTAFVANIVRVMILVLVTYYFGDEAAQGFVHGLAGMVLFLIALIMLFALDSMLGLVGRLTKNGGS